MPAAPCVIAISEVLRVLVSRAETWDPGASLSPEQDRIAQVILDEISRAPHESLHFPMLRDVRLLRVARALLEEPGSARTLEARPGGLAATGAHGPGCLCLVHCK
ncbi:hypothetical protein [Kerstersia sp.]|uniref:hypothetical protein n=1 Tax=Kerstersia sp. TaxID=1930783 RepID=UPI003F8FF4E1